MSHAEKATDVVLAHSADDGQQYVHHVRYSQWLLSKVRGTIPRTVCGASLVADPGEADPLESGAPDCPICEATS